MNDLILRWAGAGVLATGLSSSALFGAGVGVAAPDPGAGGGAAKSTQSTDGSSESAGDKTTPQSSKSADPESESPGGGADATADADSNDSGAPDQDASEDAPAGDETGEADKRSDRAARPHKNDRPATPAPSGVDRAPASLSAGADEDSRETSDARRDITDTTGPVVHRESAAVDDTATVTSTAALESPTEAEPVAKPDKPGVVDTIVGTVSSVVGALLSPFAANDTTPASPVAEPQMWTLAAASRREFENAFESPKLVEDVVPVANSLTATPPPTLTDQITLLFYDGMRAISDITGINVTAVIGGLLASENPPFFLTFGLNTQRTTYTTEDGAQWDAWEISPTEPTDKTVIALHGGGWVLQPNLLNWIDYTTIPRETGATVVVPLYPLASTEAGKATTVIPETADFISQVIDANGDPDNVSIYADSAGSSLAMSAVRELILADKPVPSHLVLLSMVADSSLANPDVATINDPLFDINHLDGWDSHYFDGIAKTDPSVSPLFWDDDTLEKLPPTTLYVGEREILYPDNLLFHDRAVDLDVPLSLVVGTGLPHDWPASGLPFIFSQTAVVHPDILRQLGLTDDDAATALSATETEEFQTLSAALTATPPLAQPGLINVVASLFFNAFDQFEAAIAGEPQVPPGSTVRVQRSTLDIDCGPGYTVNADWYFPDTEEPPTRLIYFQHGFPGSSAEYDYTAAELAERNQAIVVAPTISSNLFDCYSCQLGGDPMHAAIGRLFIGDRADLLASAKAAGFEGDALPEKFVIAGHSGGGQLAGGAAGYFEEFAPADEDHNLVGVLLFDTSPIGDAIERGVGKIPDDIPVYTIGAAPSFLNSQGGVERVLEKLRPDTFVGVELVDGTHGDVFQSHNLIVQIGGWIAGLGIPKAENIKAAQVLTQGWIDDWYDGTHTGVYGTLGTTVDVPDTGGARAYVLPAPEHQWSIIDLIAELGFESVLFTKVFATCAEDPSAAAAAMSCSGVPASVAATLAPQTQNLTELDTPKTA